MARVLIGWEFGANRGHGLRVAAIARLLRGAGHEVAFALQRLDALAPAEMGGAALWQAPLSPRMLAVTAKPPHGLPAGMADILARLGFDDPRIVAGLLRGWRQILDAARPDLVIADFAPALLLAARGRVPSISVGTGFTDPPGHMPAFPSLVSGVAGVDQAVLLETVNAGLAETGLAPLPALPAIFAADRPVIATFAELDPYEASRDAPLARPESVMADAEAGSGDEVFVYAPERIAAESPLWAGLVASRLKVRVHVARADAALQAALAGRGLTVEPEPLPFARIAERSRLLVSHGGHGTVCAALAAGLPQVVCHHDIEKLGHALAVTRMGLGGHVALGAIEPAAFGASLAAMHADEGFAARARAAAPGFRDRPGLSLAEALEGAVAALA